MGIKAFNHLPSYIKKLSEDENKFKNTVDSRLSARGLTALRLNRSNVFLKKKFYFP
jgi:hypothetical protein